MRRIGAGVVALVVLFGVAFGLVQAIGAIGALGEGPGERIANAEPDGTVPSSSEVTTPPAGLVDPAPASTVAAAPASTAPPAPPTGPATSAPAGPPSADDPATVLVVGDSDAGTFGPYLKELLDATGVVTTVVDYKVSSGLARPDFFDWPAHLREQLPEVDPDLVVVTFGGNDAQGLAEADGSFLNGDPVAARGEWVPEYAGRAGEVMDIAGEGGRTVVWVGIPNDDNPEVTARLEVQNEAVHAALATRPAVQFVDTWARFSSVNGGWAEYVIDPRDGQGKDVRAEDGFHLNTNGAEILAVDIAELVKSDLRARGASL